SILQAPLDRHDAKASSKDSTQSAGLLFPIKVRHAHLGDSPTQRRPVRSLARRDRMLRISHYLRALARPDGGPVLGARGAPGTRPPVVIWNLLRRCNLTCKHCYATSADSEFRDELDTAEALKVIDDLHEAGVRVLILSGGEPLLREDI